MVRTQIQLTEAQAGALRSLASARNVSVAELIRDSIDTFLERESSLSREIRVARAKAAIGRFSSGSPNGSSDHDRILAEALGQR